MSDIRRDAAMAAEKRAKLMRQAAGGKMIFYSLTDFTDGYIAGYEAAKAEAREALRLAEVELAEQCNDQCESPEDRASGCIFDGPEPCRIGVAMNAIRAVLAASDAAPKGGEG